MISYLQALSLNWPNVGVKCTGNIHTYESIEWENGDPLPSKAEMDAWILDYTKRLVWLGIQKERDRRKAGGVKVGEHWFHSDDSSRIQQLALVIFGANMPSNIMWKTMSGAFVEMTPSLILSIFQASAAQDMAIFTAAETHKAQMMASPDPENYDFSTGWPDTMYTGPLT